MSRNKSFQDIIADILKAKRGFSKWLYKNIIPVVMFFLAADTVFFIAVGSWGYVLAVINGIVLVILLVRNVREPSF